MSDQIVALVVVDEVMEKQARHMMVKNWDSMMINCFYDQALDPY